MIILLDTNVLLRWSDADSSGYQICQEAIMRLADAGNELRICAQAAIEYWVVATRPKDANGIGLSLAEASRNLVDIVEAFPCVPEPADILDRWHALVVKHNVSGKQAHDARIVAVMLASQVTRILTLNSVDFARYPEVVVLTPSSVPLP
jgi:predicted nucleic acid-binding protein